MSNLKKLNASLTYLKQHGEKAPNHADNAMESFSNNNKNVKGMSRQEKSRIIFPPSIIERFLRNFGFNKIMVTSNAPIFLAGAIEHIASEILENATMQARDKKHIRITVRDLELGVRNDRDLNIISSQINGLTLNVSEDPVFKQHFNDNLMVIVSELDMDINLSTHGVVQGNEFGTIPSAYMHPMELCFNIEYNNDEIILSENVANIVNIIKKYSKGFYTVNKVISKSDFI